MPKLKRELTSLAGLPPVLSDYYTKGDDGVFRLDLDLDGGWSLEKDVGKLRDAVGNERSARQKQAQMLRSFGWTLGDDGEWRKGDDALDPEAARQAVQSIKSGAVKNAAEFEDRINELKHKFQADGAEKDKKVERAHALMRKFWFENEAKRLIKELGGNEQTEMFLMPILERTVRVEIEDDKPPKVTCLDKDGRELISRVAGSAEPMQLGERLRDIRADKAFAALWPAKPVGGSGGDTLGGGSVQGGAAKPTIASGTEAAARGFLDKALAQLQGR